MKDRKQHVIRKAHELFIEKGFQATSIQDILEQSGIAKGTFYNYFSSKNELLIALLKTLYAEMSHRRDDLLIGKDPADLEPFIQQLELQLQMNHTNRLSNLFEEVFVTNDKELMLLIKEGHLRLLRWVHRRFIDVFGEEKAPYLLDCAIMFMGILNQTYKYYVVSQPAPANISKVVRYSIERLVHIVEEVSAKEVQLIDPKLFEAWLPTSNKSGWTFPQKLHHAILSLKKKLNQTEHEEKYTELLDFIYDELVNTSEPRQFLIESIFSLLQSEGALYNKEELQELEQLLDDFFGSKSEKPKNSH